MKKFILYLGLNDKNTKKQEVNTLEAYKIVNNILFDYVDGATIFEANGIYKHKDGSITVEKTLQIELLTIEKNQVLEIIEKLKTIFNQESIALCEQNISSELI